MNGPDIQQLIFHDLQCAVAERGEPPPLRPLDVSPWLAMSILQKAIRRSHEDLALGAAATLLRRTPDKLWRRIGCIAFEDVGVGNLQAGTRDGGGGGKASSRRTRRGMGGRRLRGRRTLSSAEVQGRRRSRYGL